MAMTAHEMESEEWVQLTEACRRAGVARSTGEVWAWSGRIPARQIKGHWHVQVSDLAAEKRRFQERQSEEEHRKRQAEARAASQSLAARYGPPVTIEEWFYLTRREWAREHHRILPDGRVAIDANLI